MEKVKLKKVFVNLNQKWETGEIQSEKDNQYEIKLSDGQALSIEMDNKHIELRQRPAQKYAYADLKQKLEGEYVSYNKLFEDNRNIIDSLVEGKEYLHESTYMSEGRLKESVKMLQMGYDRNSNSKLDVQIKRNEPIKFEDATAYNHKFTAEEFENMVKKGKTIKFEGNSNDGEVFEKLAYYENRLNDIRVKPVLTDKMYFYGKKLTPDQAKSLNEGKEIKMTISSTKNGDKDYMVSYSPRSESFKTQSLDKILAESQKQGVKGMNVEKQDVKAEKKKSRGRGITV